MATEIGTINFPRDTTLQSIADSLTSQNALLQVLANDSISAITSDWSSIHRLVKRGYAPEIFSIGQQLSVNWKDTVTGTSYATPYDIVSFNDVTLETGDVVPAMWLQQHYATRYIIMFDQTEALYYCDEDLPAGTYYFTIGTNWGTYCVSGTSYYFTTTVDIPAGGQIRIGVASENNAWGAPDTAPSNWRVWTYSSPSSTSSLEGAGLELTEGTEGTELGTTTSSIKYSDSGINNLQLAGYGYNRWSQCAYRQYLNSSAAIGSWWNPQNNFDRAPSQLGSYPGFMSGFDDDFLACLKPIKVTTALNTQCDSNIGTSEDTYDTFFLPSLEQLYITPQLSGVEGDAWEYWKEVIGSSSTVVQYVNGAFPKFYAMENTSSAQNVLLRSANRGYSTNVWNVNSSGGVYTGGASYACRCAPACCIC